MKLYEFITPEVDEGWKSNLATAGLGAALTLGGIGMRNTQQDAPTTPSLQQSASIKKSASPIDVLKHAAAKADIKGNELTHFISQASHETLNFSKMEEMGSQSYLAKKYDITHNPRKAKILGNTQKGDGVKYKGRGFLQITGRYNYRKAGEALGLPLEERPEMVERPDIAAKVAVWYWNLRVKPKVSNFDKVSDVTKQINPGMKGLKSRQQQYAKYRSTTESLTTEQT